MTPPTWGLGIITILMCGTNAHRGAPQDRARNYEQNLAQRTSLEQKQRVGSIQPSVSYLVESGQTLYHLADDTYSVWTADGWLKLSGLSPVPLALPTSRLAGLMIWTGCPVQLSNARRTPHTKFQYSEVAEAAHYKPRP